jgi:hypothetical protein
LLRNTPQIRALQRGMTRLGPVLILSLLASSAPAAQAAPLPVSGTLDLVDAPSEQTVRRSGTEQGSVAGGAVAGVGDFDGDGKRDVAVGEPKRDTAAGTDSGAVHVVLDAATGGSLAGATDVVTIRGAQAGDYAGFDVAAAGDVNGDGLQDLLVGAPLAGPRPDEATTVGGGEAYLVFGRPGRAEIDLASEDFGGIRITGGDLYSWLGRSVAAIPDLNGDARPELLVGAPLRKVGDRQDAGSAYVVFGRADSGATVDVSRLVEDAAGWRIDGAQGHAGRALGSIGDLNGDARPEVLVTAPLATAGANNEANGVAYVVYGQATPGVVDLERLRGQGWAVSRDIRRPGGEEPRSPADFLGESITGLGDVNGDDRPDLIVGAHLQDGPDRVRGGIAYVVFGKSDDRAVDLAELRDGGYRIVGVGRGDTTGFATASAGDFNADGVNDVAVGAPFADPLSRDNAGAVYVIYGREGEPREVDLAEIGERGIRIAGRPGDATGFTLDGVGDVNGDGGDDLAIGSPATSADYLFDLASARAGSASIAFGAARASDIPGGELKSDPGYREAIREGCRPALNVQAIMDDDAYNDEQADPQRIRLTGMQAYVATPRNFGTVLGVSAFDSEGNAAPPIEPQELSKRRVDFLKRDLKESITGQDAFPGYDRLFGTLADDNPSAGGRIMIIDGYTFRSVRRLRGLTNGSAPTYIIAVGDPPDRNKVDKNQMRRIARETKGRYFEARTPREIERALQAIQSRLRCDVEADVYQEELQGDEVEELDEIDLDEDTYSADIVLSWRNDEEDYEFEEIEVLDAEGDDVTSEFDDEFIDEAYEIEEESEEEEDEEDVEGRAAQAIPPRLTGGRGRTFRSLHIRRLRGNRRLRIVIRSDNRRSSGRVFTRVTQSRNRR